MSPASRTFRRCLVFAATILAAGSVQAWEFAYGPPTALDDAQRRVTPVAPCGGFGSGYIAVGTRRLDIVGTSDVYVVRTDLAGAADWEMTYDVQNLGLDDQGMAIAAIPGAGYVFLSNSMDGVWRPALTFIRCDGSVVWSRIYPDVATGQHLLGRDLIVAQTGNLAAGTSAGDLIVAGFWQSGADEDAFLMRTTALGAGPIWSALYHSGREAFHAVTEAAPLPGSPSGDLVAVGRFGFSDPQGLVARVSGDDGTLAAPRHCMAHHGHPGSAEIYNSVTQLAAAHPYPGQLAMVGTTRGAASGEDVWVTRGDPCTLAAQSRLGEPFGVSREQGFDIRQVLAPTVGGPPVGSLAIAGFHAKALSPTDALLLFVQTGPLTPTVGSSRLFGDFGAADEIFFSLAQNPAGVGHPPGFVLAGQTRSDWDGFGDPQDLYLVHYDPASAGCEKTWEAAPESLAWPVTPLAPALRAITSATPVPTPAEPHSDPLAVCL